MILVRDYVLGSNCSKLCAQIPRKGHSFTYPPPITGTWIEKKKCIYMWSNGLHTMNFLISIISPSLLGTKPRFSMLSKGEWKWPREWQTLYYKPFRGNKNSYLLTYPVYGPHKLMSNLSKQSSLPEIIRV